MGVLAYLAGPPPKNASSHSPLDPLPRLGTNPIPQIVSGFSRMAAAALATLPPYRANGDEDAVARLIRRPNSALEAAARAPMELIYGFTGAGGGLLLDPIAVRCCCAC